MDVHWYLAAQDGYYPWDARYSRVVDFNYMRQQAAVIDGNGYAGALIATTAGGTDPWTLAAGLATQTRHMKFIVAQYAGAISPLWLAQMAATVDEISQGRLIVNIITGHDRGQPQYGIRQGHDERYELADEYWGVWRRLMLGETVTFEGKHVQLANAKLLLETVQKPCPELMFGGSSEPALDFAARHADTWLSAALPPPVMAKKVADVKARAAAHGRTIRCGIRLYVIVRPTEAEAWAAAQDVYDHIDPETLARRQATLEAEKRDGNVAKLQVNDLIHTKPLDGDRPKDARAYEVYPHLWGGYGLVRGGPGTAIVGDPNQVVALMREYQAAGIDVFIFGNNPHVEEAYRFADLIMPLLGKKDGHGRPLWF